MTWTDLAVFGALFGALTGVLLFDLWVRNRP